MGIPRDGTMYRWGNISVMIVLNFSTEGKNLLTLRMLSIFMLPEGAAYCPAMSIYPSFCPSVLYSVTALCPRARHINHCLVQVQHRKTRPDITERLLTGT